MKTTLAVIALTFVSLSSQAASTCFFANSLVPQGAPKSICLRNVSIDQASASATINSDLTDTEVKSLDITSFVRHNENSAQFTAEAVIIDTTSDAWASGCMEGKVVTVKISGQVNSLNEPSVDVKSLKVSADYSYTHDVCHSPDNTQTFDYTVE